MIEAKKKLVRLFNSGHKACTDSRSVKPGDIFFALKGEYFNGNSFANQAIEKGAVLAVVDEEIITSSEKIIQVDSVLETLQQTSKAYRNQFSIPIIAITGSNGKTTTKELVRAVLASTFNTLSTSGNLNNHIGVPLTLLQLRKTHQVAVIEMGANHLGEIELLSSIADPGFGLITNVGKAHLEGFGSLENVVVAKSELYQQVIKNGGILFVNGDNPILTKKADGARQVLYGANTTNHLLGRIIDKGPRLNLQFEVLKDFGDAKVGMQGTVSSKLVGEYNFENLLAALAIGLFFGVDPSNAKKALDNYTPANHRSQLVETSLNTVILDAYNANPTSMNLALKNLASLTGPKKAAIIGDMLELGPASLDEHEKTASILRECNFDINMVVGQQFKEATKGRKEFLAFENVEEAIEWLKTNKIVNHLVLIKGSRGIKMEKVMEFI